MFITNDMELAILNAVSANINGKSDKSISIVDQSAIIIGTGTYVSSTIEGNTVVINGIGDIQINYDGVLSHVLTSFGSMTFSETDGGGDIVVSKMSVTEGSILNLDSIKCFVVEG